MILSYGELAVGLETFSAEEEVLLNILHSRINEKLTQLFVEDTLIYEFNIESDTFWNFNDKMMDRIIEDIGDAEWDVVIVEKYQKISLTGVTLTSGLLFRLEKAAP